MRVPTLTPPSWERREPLPWGNTPVAHISLSDSRTLGARYLGLRVPLRHNPAHLSVAGLMVAADLPWLEPRLCPSVVRPPTLPTVEAGANPGGTPRATRRSCHRHSKKVFGVVNKTWRLPTATENWWGVDGSGQYSVAVDQDRSLFGDRPCGCPHLAVWLEILPLAV